MNLLLRCASVLNEPRHALWVYLVSLLLYSVTQVASILCLILAWHVDTSIWIRGLFVVCCIVSLLICQHWLQVTSHRYLAPVSAQAKPLCSVQTGE